MTDYYKVLGIESNASQAEIKKAYRKLSTKFHPDKNNGDYFFENMFKQIQEAYGVLGNINKKNEYDSKFDQYFNQANSGYQYSNFEPVIEFFQSNKTRFYSGDEVRFKWKTFNADILEINPFGLVDPNGDTIFKINNVNKQFLDVVLVATNTNISKSVTKIITLENKIFKDAQSQSVYTNGNHKTFYSKEKTTYNGKTIAIVSYITIIGWIIALIMHLNKKTTLGAFHIKQMFSFIILGFISSIIDNLFDFYILTILIQIGLLILWILGFVSAIQGKKKPISIFGR
jgi:curved DNA-binding protein CbpA|tara:strand:+ start:181279 stop:182136 length:858 start_codon:yes stop_codon:yes gene_type:complete